MTAVKFLNVCAVLSPGARSLAWPPLSACTLAWLRTRSSSAAVWTPITWPGSWSASRPGREVQVADIQLVDTSVRDGNQSLWGATGLTTAHILQIAPVMDRVGF